MALRTLRALLVSRLVPFLALCLPALCSLMASSSATNPSPIHDEPQLAGLAFDQYYVNLREVAPSEEVYAYFTFHNVGHTKVTIDELKPSCGCLTPQLKMQQREYAPGEEGEFLLRVRTTAQQPGPKEFSVKVHYTDTQPRVCEVFLRAVFPQEQIYARPMSLTVHQLGTTSVEQDIVVTDLRTTPHEILGVSASSELVKVSVVPPTTTATGARVQRVKVSVPGPVPAGRHMVIVKIFTDDSKFNELKVPIQVYGPDKHGKSHRLAQPPLIGPVLR